MLVGKKWLGFQAAPIWKWGLWGEQWHYPAESICGTEDEGKKRKLFLFWGKGLWRNGFSDQSPVIGFHKTEGKIVLNALFTSGRIVLFQRAAQSIQTIKTNLPEDRTLRNFTWFWIILDFILSVKCDGNKLALWSLALHANQNQQKSIWCHLSRCTGNLQFSVPANGKKFHVLSSLLQIASCDYLYSKNQRHVQ